MSYLASDADKQDRNTSNLFNVDVLHFHCNEVKQFCVFRINSRSNFRLPKAIFPNSNSNVYLLGQFGLRIRNRLIFYTAPSSKRWSLRTKQLNTIHKPLIYCMRRAANLHSHLDTEKEWDSRVTDFLAFKLDHLQSVKPIIIPKFYNFYTGANSYYPRDREREWLKMGK